MDGNFGRGVDCQLLDISAELLSLEAFAAAMLNVFTRRFRFWAKRISNFGMRRLFDCHRKLFIIR